MKLRRLWIVMTKVSGSFWHSNVDTNDEHKAKLEVLAFERGGYLARVIRDEYERVVGSSYRCVSVR